MTKFPNAAGSPASEVISVALPFYTRQSPFGSLKYKTAKMRNLYVRE
jgi:hypothetical protein